MTQKMVFGLSRRNISQIAFLKIDIKIKMALCIMCFMMYKAISKIIVVLVSLFP